MEKHKFNLYPEITGSLYEELKASISNGYDNTFPIVIYQGYVLDGWNRYLVCKELDILPPQENFEGDDVEAIEYVIRSNNRRDLEPSQRAALALQYKPLFEIIGKERMSLGGKGVELVPHLDKGKSRDQAGALFGVSGRYVSDAQYVKDNDEELLQDIVNGNITIKEAKREIKKESQSKENEILAGQYVEDSSITLLRGDFRELCQDIPDNSIDLVLTDLPYPAEYLDLWEPLSKISSRVLKPNHFLAAYSGQFHLPYVINALSKHLNYFWTFALYHVGQSQIVNVRNLMCQWKPILIFCNGDKQGFDTTIPDYIVSERPEKSSHEWQQNEKAISNLIEYLTKPDDLVLDVCAGSGTTGVAARKLKRRSILIDINADCVTKIKARLYENDCKSEV